MRTKGRETVGRRIVLRLNQAAPLSRHRQHCVRNQLGNRWAVVTSGRRVPSDLNGEGNSARTIRQRPLSGGLLSWSHLGWSHRAPLKLHHVEQVVEIPWSHLMQTSTH